MVDHAADFRRVFVMVAEGKAKDPAVGGYEQALRETLVVEGVVAAIGLIKQETVIGGKIVRFVFIGSRIEFQMLLDNGQNQFVHMIPQLVLRPEIDRNSGLAVCEGQGLDCVYHAVRYAELPWYEIPRVFHFPIVVGFQDQGAFSGLFPEPGSAKPVGFINHDNRCRSVFFG